MIKVCELWALWLYSTVPNSELIVWSRSETDYILNDELKSELSSAEIFDIVNKEVLCFYSGYNKEADKNLLYVNVE